jgi:hypothetical protein
LDCRLSIKDYVADAVFPLDTAIGIPGGSNCQSRRDAEPAILLAKLN